MRKPKLSEIANVAEESFKRAYQAAEGILFFSENLQEQYERSKAASTLSGIPQYQNLQVYQGKEGWGAIMSFDLRGSTKRAQRLGAKKTYLTMHTYLPTMLKVIKDCAGIVVGMRGDGAIVYFGLVEGETDPQKIPKKDKENAVRDAAVCGDAMIRTMVVVNTVLEKNKIDGDLKLGVGVDAGPIVITNIGLGRANDLTAYGDPVNNACKFHGGNNTVHLSNLAWQTYPSTQGGNARFRRVSSDPRGVYHVLSFQNQYSSLLLDVG